MPWPFCPPDPAPSLPFPQTLQQTFNDPFLAIVVDPHRTLAAGRVEVGAFRTYPEGARPAASAAAAVTQTIPIAKVEDFGVHAGSYYPLDVRVFASSLDASLLRALWGRYWAATLAASPLASTAALAEAQAADIAEKLAVAAGGDATPRALLPGARAAGAGSDASRARLAAASRDGARLATEQAKGLASQAVKRAIFGAAVAVSGGGARPMEG